MESHVDARLEQTLNALEPETSRIFTVRLAPGRAIPAGPLTGLEVSVKDNIDVAGVTTTAGAAAFRTEPAAAADAPVVARLRAAGAHVFAKTNMTEFAYSTHGVNRHFGTPSNPASPVVPRITGGSSSGAAAAVARGLGDAAIGTDTAGSVRVPAALCGVVGLKPRQRRIPLGGVVPLSTTYDCVGVLATRIDMVARVFAAIADPATAAVAPAPARAPTHRYRVLVPTEMDPAADQDTSDEVRAAFDAALAALGRDGRFEIIRASARCYADVQQLTPEGGIVGPEAYAYHKPYLERHRDEYDAFTLQRLAFGERCSAERYINLVKRRRALVEEAHVQLAPFDVILHPSCPITAVPIADLSSVDALMNVSLRQLRYSIQANALDLPSLSIPCPTAPGGLPIGLCLESTGTEETLLAMGETISAVLPR